MPTYQSIEVEQIGPTLRVWLDDPEIRNAFNPGVISELTVVFRSIVSSGTIRAVILGGKGRIFCSGADLNWMSEMIDYTRDQNYQDAFNLAEMMAAIDSCPVPVVGRVQGGAFGGALGLLACCDTVVAASDCVFSFSEVRLGLSPATIAPYVIRKTGLSHARDLMLSGRRFDSDRALRVNLVHRLVEPEDLDRAVGEEVSEYLKTGPQAVAATKDLVSSLTGEVSVAIMEETARLIADLRISDEGQEGLKSFAERRKPDWQELD